MSELVRLYRYKSLLSGRRAMAAEQLMQALEVSRATLKRDIAKLRDQLGMPIRFDRDRGGYILESQAVNPDHELPGLWFSDEEVLALVTIQQLLTQLEPGLLGPRLRPLQTRFAQLMEKHGLNGQAIAQRVRIVHAGKRRMTVKSFEVMAAATLARKQVKVWHVNRQTGKTVERILSPQRLVYYRDNWYVDAWCHLRADLRSFSVDAISKIEVLNTTANEIDPKRIDDTVAAGYGIFSGAPKAWATLRFSPQRARWVEREIWHPQQESRTEPDGSYLITIPYSDDRELLGDILRFGGDVKVLGPRILRNRVQKALLAAVENYIDGS